MNNVPKDGGNRFIGGFKAAKSPQSWQGDNLTDDLVAKGVSAVDRISNFYEWNIEQGGPILRDKLTCDPLEERPGLNDRIACIAEERSVGLIDLHAAFLGREDELTRFRSGDVHPTADGYVVIAEAILEALAARLGRGS